MIFLRTLCTYLVSDFPSGFFAELTRECLPPKGVVFFERRFGMTGGNYEAPILLDVVLLESVLQFV
jgi:hypothetical protein